MVEIPVQPSVLRWAREERGLSREQAAARLSLTPEELAALETEPRHLRLGFLEQISASYKIPLVALLMPVALPVAGRPLQDFRAFEGAAMLQLSPETVLAIDQACTYVEMLADLRDVDPAAFGSYEVPSCRLDDDPRELAFRERKRLSIGFDEQRNWRKDRDAFLRWRELIEAQGIFTYQIKFGDDDARGVCILDDNNIPIILIDASESDYRVKIFSLWHE